MCYNRIAILADLRNQLVNGTCNPSRGLAELAAPLLVDDSYKPRSTDQLMVVRVSI